jgi:hypothetical protein
MAITISQSPTFPAIANSDLVYVVASSQASQPQFQFVVDIKDENGTLIQRVKQQPNPQGYGVFNLGNLISYQFDNTFDIPTQTWYSNPVVNAPIQNQLYITAGSNGGEVKQINVLFGEEYAVSATATSSIYDGNGALGNPAVTSSNDWSLFFDGVLDTNDRFPLWSGSWNFTTEFDKYRQLADSALPYDYYKGKGKWIPMPIWGIEEANQTLLVEFDAKYPPNQLYEYNVGLTDYPISRSVYWDDLGTISYLQGTDLSPAWQIANPTGSLFPYAQLIIDASLTFNFADGTSTTTTQPFNRDWLSVWKSGGNGNFIYDRYSQSLDNTIIHVPIFPNNYEISTNYKNPIDNPSNYLVSYDIEAYGYKMPNEMGFTNNYTLGLTRSGFDAVEFGSLAYVYPYIVINNSGVTGSDAGSTAFAWFRGNTGGDVQVHFSQSDFIYPSTTYACASAYQIVKTINDRMVGASSSIRAWIIPNPQFPNNLGTTYTEANGYKGAPYHILVGDISDVAPYSTTLHVLTKSGENDFLGTKVAGELSCLGIGTGNYNGFGSSTDSVNEYLSGSVYDFVSTYDKRHFDVDWSGYGELADCVDCGYQRRQFMWKNKYGVLDYFTFTKAITITNDIERQQYNQSFLNYGTSTSVIPFDKSRRGTTQYYNKITQRYIVESDWMTQTEADYIKEMFFSTAVFLLDKQNSDAIRTQNLPTTEYVDVNTSDYNYPLAQHRKTTPSAVPFFQVQQVPIVITNAQLVEKTNPRTQKLYKVSAEFVYANDLNARV